MEHERLRVGGRLRLDEHGPLLPSEPIPWGRGGGVPVRRRAREGRRVEAVERAGGRRREEARRRENPPLEELGREREDPPPRHRHFSLPLLALRSSLPLPLLL